MLGGNPLDTTQQSDHCSGAAAHYRHALTYTDEGNWISAIEAVTSAWNWYDALKDGANKAKCSLLAAHLYESIGAFTVATYLRMRARRENQQASTGGT